MSNLTVTNVNGQVDLEGRTKAWCNFNGTGSISTRDSFNISSLVDITTGEYSVNFTDSFSAADYSVSGAAGSRTTASGFTLEAPSRQAPTTGDIRVSCITHTGTITDSDTVSLAIFGDLV